MTAQSDLCPGITKIEEAKLKMSRYQTSAPRLLCWPNNQFLTAAEHPGVYSLTTAGVFGVSLLIWNIF